MHYNKKCQQGQPPKDKKDFLKKEVFKMATATATCKCTHCGKEFEVYRRNFFNRRQADEWVEWAESNGNYTCPECYAEQRAEERQKEKAAHDEKMKQAAERSNENGNEIKEMHYREYKNNYADFDTVPDSYNPDTKTIKVIVPNYDKKIEIINEVVSSIDSTHKWFDLGRDTKIKEIKRWETFNVVEERYKFDLEFWTSELISGAKEKGLI